MHRAVICWGITGITGCSISASNTWIMAGLTRRGTSIVIKPSWAVTIRGTPSISSTSYTVITLWCTGCALIITIRTNISTRIKISSLADASLWTKLTEMWGSWTRSASRCRSCASQACWCASCTGVSRSVIIVANSAGASASDLFPMCGRRTGSAVGCCMLAGAGASMITCKEVTGCGATLCIHNHAFACKWARQLAVIIWWVAWGASSCRVRKRTGAAGKVASLERESEEIGNKKYPERRCNGPHKLFYYIIFNLFLLPRNHNNIYILSSSMTPRRVIGQASPKRIEAYSLEL